MNPSEAQQRPDKATATKFKEPLHFRLVKGSIMIPLLMRAFSDVTVKNLAWAALVGVGLYGISAKHSNRHNWIVGGLLVCAVLGAHFYEHSTQALGH